MKTSNLTILITGGGSGIGRALAEEFHRRGNLVVISGRRQAALDSVTSANPGMKSLVVDLTNPANIQAFAGRLVKEFPALNAIIHNAGIMRPEDLLGSPANLADAEEIVTTNLLGPLRLNAALLPTLLQQSAATIMTVSSGLAFVPMALTPTYSATKAAIHSYTQALRYQLRETNIEVLELIPPYVATELMGERQAQDPRAMPLEEFISEVMTLLDSGAGPEINVQRVHPLRFAASQGEEKYQETFLGLNEAMSKSPH